MITMDQIRTLYAYHIALHRRAWDSIMTLSDAQFVQDVPYSIGSLRNHAVHLASVEQRWFSRIMGDPLPDRLVYTDYPTREAARTAWDTTEARIIAALESLTDADLPRTVDYVVRRVDPVERTIAATSAVWQILVHVVNHATDHRAQMLRILHESGAPTFEQDIMIHWWEMAE